MQRLPHHHPKLRVSHLRFPPQPISLPPFHSILITLLIRIRSLDFAAYMTSMMKCLTPKYPSYNGAAGPFEAVVNMAPVQPPQR